MSHTRIAILIVLLLLGLGRLGQAGGVSLSTPPVWLNPNAGQGTICMVLNAGDNPIDVLIQIVNDSGIAVQTRTIPVVPPGTIVSQANSSGDFMLYCQASSSTAKAGDLLVTLCVLDINLRGGQVCAHEVTAP